VLVLVTVIKMQYSKHIVQVIVILGLVHIVPAQKLFSVITPQFVMHETDWEKELETGIVALEANCNENDVPFDREKVTKDLRACLHPIITQDPMAHLDPFQKQLSHEELFRQIYVEPICSRVSMSMDCLKPHRKIIENCARDDGKALQELLKSACKLNGTKIAEFVKEGGFECVSKQPDEFAACFKPNTEKEVLSTSKDVCSYFRSVRDCAIPLFFKCDKKKPGKIVRAIFEEVNTETKGKCLGDSSPGSRAIQFASASGLVLSLLVTLRL